MYLASVAETLEVSIQSPDRPLEGLRVLLVEDNADARDILQYILENNGALVMAAEGGAQGLDALRRVHADAIVSDLSMPGMDGVTFLQQVRTLLDEGERPTPAIALTAFRESEHRRRALAAGFDLYLLKPVDWDVLVHEILRLVRARRAAKTLGEVLYADKATPVWENEWVGIVRSVGRGDQLALHELYDRTHSIVFTLIVQIAGNRETAEELMLDVFHYVWCRASTYDAGGGSVIGWIMNHARSTAIDRVRFEQRKERVGPDGATTDMLHPSESVWDRLSRRIVADAGGEPVPALRRSTEPDWKEVASGISVKILATNTENKRVTLLVRLAPGAHYPPHVHAGLEELFMLHGELTVNGKRLYPGDYLRSEESTVDHLVWSDTGCAGVLITSYRDVLS